MDMLYTFFSTCVIYHNFITDRQKYMIYDDQGQQKLFNVKIHDSVNIAYRHYYKISHNKTTQLH